MASRQSAKKTAPKKATSAAAKKASLASPAKPPARKKPESLRLRSVAPSFTVSDIEKSVAWYRDVLGFVVTERYEVEGRLQGVILAAGSAVFMLGQDDWKKGKRRKKGIGFRLYCMTAQDVDAVASAIKARGGALDHEPTDQPWGMRDFAVTDPDGFQITISTEPKKS